MIPIKTNIATIPSNKSVRKITPQSSKEILFRILKLLVIPLSFAIVLYKIESFASQPGNNIFSNWQITDTVLLIEIIALMLMNWLIEAVRWQILTRDIQKVSIASSLFGVIIGITVGLLTPKRIGEIGGRSLILKRENQKKGWIAFGIGSLIQTSVTALFGLISLFYIYSLGQAEFMKNIKIFTYLSLFVFSLITLSVFHLPLIVKKLKKFSFLARRKHIFTYLQNFSRKKLAIVYGLGMFKFIIFSSQFFLLIRLFGSDINILNAFSGISLTYLIITFSPFSSIADLGIRGSVTAFAFSIFSNNTGGIVIASMALWIINLGIPALIGSILFNNLRLVKSRLYSYNGNN